MHTEYSAGSLVFHQVSRVQSMGYFLAGTQVNRIKIMLSFFGRTQKMKSCWLVCSVLIGMVAMSASPALASPVHVFECDITFRQAPSPILSIQPRYTIRRHVIEREPTDEFVTEAWSQGRFANDGSFEVDVYPSLGGVETERATSIRTFILDGKIDVRDEIIDEGLETEETLTFEGYKLDNFNVIFSQNEGSILTNHLDYPESFDLQDYDQEECIVYWRAPAPVPCGNIGVLCDIGAHMGTITAVSIEEHEQDHGNTFQINAGLNDAWVSEDAPFQGMFITVYPDLGLIFIAWFTFDTTIPSEPPAAVFGAPDQRWVTAVGTFNGNKATLNAELTSGGIFHSLEPTPNQDTGYGTIELEFSGCREATVKFDFPVAMESGEFVIHRVLEENAALCDGLDSG